MAAVKFHYTRDTPTESTFNDVRALNKFDSDQFESLSVILITFLSDQNKTSSIEELLEKFIAENGLNASSLKAIVKSVLSVLTGCLKLNLDSSLVKQDLMTLGLGEEKAEKFSTNWKNQQVALTRAVLSQTLSVNQLVDMEWKFGVTAASSELKKVGSTFLQLKLVIDKGHTRENVHMELTLPQFYSFLHEMEKAKSCMEYLG